MADILNPGAATRNPDFPHAPPEWSSASAEQAARADRIDLESDHWGVIKALQSYFASHARPNVRELHDALEEVFHSKGGIKYLYGLFPGGPVAQGCRFAGLRAPAGAADKSFGSVQ
jgi:TusE/DsrC/DsvC family sulfur relay protein